MKIGQVLLYSLLVVSMVNGTVAGERILPQEQAEEGPSITLDPQQGSGEMELTYSVASDYEIIIPERVSLSDTLAVRATLANTEPGHAVNIRIAQGLDADGNVTLKRQHDEAYTIKAKLNREGAGNAEVIDAQTVIASFADVNSLTTGATLSFGEPISPDNGEIKAGTYQGSITFQASYEDLRAQA